VQAEPRLAAIYDDLDPDRSDLEPYRSLVGEFGERRCRRWRSTSRP
jgi:hypothetical protein